MLDLRSFRLFSKFSRLGFGLRVIKYDDRTMFSLEQFVNLWSFADRLR